MAVVTFNRPKRVTPPPMPRGDLLLEPPPEIPPPAAKQGFGAILRMLPMVAGAMAMALMMLGGTGGRGPMGGIVGGLYGISMLGMMVTQTGRGNDEQAQQLDASRRDYFRYLSQIRRQVRESADQQRAAVEFRHPAPDTLWTIPGGRRLWERRVDNDDFGSLRVSVGRQQFAKRLTPPESQPLEDLEPLTTSALRRFIRTHRLVQSVPLSINMNGFMGVKLVGDEQACRKLAYAMVGQLATWHSPSDVRLMACVAPEHQPAWQWVKWLPHLQSPTEVDGVGSLRLFATASDELQTLAVDAQGETSDSVPSLMVVLVDNVDDAAPAMFSTPSTKSIGLEVTGMEKIPRRLEERIAYLEVRDGTLVLHRRTPKGQTVRTSLGKPDQISMVYAEMLARQISPYRLPVSVIGTEVQEEETATQAVFEAPKDYPAMLGVPDPLTLDVRQSWKPRPLHNHLRIPFGTAEDGSPAELDIKESAMGGMGPHGICIGATGSGKSEFLRTLVLGLAMTHSTEQLNFVLVDFKGGATFLGLDELPHTSAVITNLADEMTLVDRMQDAITGELERRQEVFKEASSRLNRDIKNREDYEKARQAGADLPPMPSLLIVVDEFSEMLTAKPEFLDIFLQIGRVGRSLSVHQLLASQRLEEGKLKGLDTFLSYRIALRTFSAAESRTIIGVPDAYELPPGPGNGYLKFGTAPMIRFKAAYVSGPWHGSPSSPTGSSGAKISELNVPERHWVPPVLEFTTSRAPIVRPPEPEVSPEAQELESPSSAFSVGKREQKVEDRSEEDEETLLSIVVGRLKGHGWPAHQVWLPPLDAPSTMDQLLGGVVEDPKRGLQAQDPHLRGTLAAPIALVDKPRLQRRDPMWLDYSGAAGNLAVVGGPQSGKSMALRAGLAGLALTHTPEEVGFYCLDFGGGGLTSMRDLSHMGSVCGRLDVDRVRRTIAEINNLRTEREVAFTEMGIDSMNSYRRGRADGSIPKDRFPTDVFLIIDGWGTLRQEFEPQEQTIINLASGGLGFGIHVWLAANKWGDIRANIRDSLQSRVELKLGDAYESEVNRKIQALVPGGRPGRGLTGDGLHMLTGLPRVDSVENADDVADGQKDLIARMNAAWKGPRAAEVRMLPDHLPFADLPAITHDGVDRSIPYGVDEDTLSAVYLEAAMEPHFVVFGAPECGKSNFLKVILKGITTRYAPNEAKIMIVDYRRSLLGEVGSDYLIGYAPSQKAAMDLMSDAAAAVRTRLPGPEVTQQQLIDRSWWKGADMFVIVDDYELVATSSGNPMAAFSDLVSQAQDIGLHLILARSMGGAGRTLFSDPLISKMKDAVNPALIMSGSKDEGALFGNVKPSPLPPGRGTLATRAGNKLVQIANLSDPPEGK